MFIKNWFLFLFLLSDYCDITTTKAVKLSFENNPVYQIVCVQNTKLNNSKYLPNNNNIEIISVQSATLLVYWLRRMCISTASYFLSIYPKKLTTRTIINILTTTQKSHKLHQRRRRLRMNSFKAPALRSKTLYTITILTPASLRSIWIWTRTS